MDRGLCRERLKDTVPGPEHRRRAALAVRYFCQRYRSLGMTISAASRLHHHTSAQGHSRRFDAVRAESAHPPRADIWLA